MDTVSTETICAKSYKEKRRTRKSDKVIVKGECQSLDQNNTDTRLTGNVTERNLILEGLQIKEEAQSVGTKINTGPTEVISEGCDIGNRRKKRKRNPRGEIEAEVRCEMDARNFAEGNPTTMKPKFKDRVQKTSSNIMDKGSTENPTGKMKKKRKGKKANLVGDVQNELDARSTDNLDEENLTIKVSKVGLTRMNSGSAEDPADVNVIIEHPKTLIEAQSMGQDTMDTWQLAENIVQGNVAGKRRKKRNKNKAKVNDEDHREMDTRSTGATLNELGIKDAAQGVTQTQTNTGSTDNVAERNVTIENLKVQDEIQSIDQAKLISPSEDLSEGNVTVKRKKSQNRTRKAKVNNGFSGSMDEGSTENMTQIDLNIKIPETRDEVPSMGPKVMDAGSIEVQDGILSIDQAKRIMPTEDFSEGNVTVKSKKKRKKTKAANVKDDFSSRMDAELSKNLAEVDANIRIPETRDEVPSMGLNEGSTENMTEIDLHIKIPETRDEVPSMGPKVIDAGSTEVQDGILSIDQAKRIMPTEDFSEGNVTVKSKKKRQKTKGANVKDQFSSRMDAELSKNLAEVDADIRIPETRDKVPSMGLNEGSTENMTEIDLHIKIPETRDEVPSMGPKVMDAGSTEVQDGILSIDHAKRIIPTEDFSEGNVNVKSKKKRKKTKAATVKDEFSSRMDAELSKNLAEVDADIRIPETRDKVPSMGLNEGSTENMTEIDLHIKIPETRDEVPSMGPKVMDAGSTEVQDGILSIDHAKRIIPTEDFSEGNVNVKSKKKRKKTKAATVKDEFSSRMDAELSKNLAEVDADIRIPETRDKVPSMGLNEGSTENMTEIDLHIKIPETRDEVPSMGPKVMDAGSTEVQDGILSIDQAKRIMPTEDFSEGNVTVKSKKKRKKTKAANVKDEFSSRMDAELSKNLAEVDANIRIPETRDKVPSMGLKVIDAGSTENLRKENLTFENPKITDEGQSVDSGPAEDFTKAGKRKNKRRSTRKQKIVSEHPSVGRGGTMLNGSSQVSTIILDEGIDHREGRSAISTCNACSVKDTEDLCLRMAPFASVRRKLLVLDINGLLADVVYPAPKHDRGEDIRFYGRAVFKRPFCGDFLKFCFQNFNVGIWSSRSKKIIDKVVSYLLGDQKDKLLFCWDMEHSTTTGFKTLENRHKPLVCKELRKIWEKDDPSWPWEKGDYNESNTLLLDDSPYKALLNPLHTAIFPHPFQYSDKNDNSLGPGGDLRVYLEGLLGSENVQKYVEQHPFGQSHISEADISWKFYDKVLKQISKDKTTSVET